MRHQGQDPDKGDDSPSYWSQRPSGLDRGTSAGPGSSPGQAASPLLICVTGLPGMGYIPLPPHSPPPPPARPKKAGWTEPYPLTPRLGDKRAPLSQKLAPRRGFSGGSSSPVHLCTPQTKKRASTNSFTQQRQTLREHFFYKMGRVTSGAESGLPNVHSSAAVAAL